MTANRQTPVCGRSLPRAMVGLAALLWTLAGLGSLATANAGVLDDVRTRGHLVCGITEGAAGFANVAPSGAWAGLDVDFCSAVATAALGRSDAVKYRVLTPANRFLALTANEVDLLPRANALTLSRDTEQGARFVGTLFHDGQGFLVRRGFAVTSVLELSGASVCLMTGTAAEQGLATFFQTRKMRYQIVPADKWIDTVKAYADGGCTLLTGDVSILAAERSRLALPSEHLILPELINKERLGPFVRRGEDQWFSIVRWTLEALIWAEELGITSQNIDTLRSSSNPDVRRFLGIEGDLGQPLGLARDWTYQVVKQVGNYGELFERNIGARSALALDRGVNALWNKGGLMSGAPLR